MKKNEYIKTLLVDGKSYEIMDIMRLEKNGIADINRLPFSIRILVENLLRHFDGRVVSEKDLLTIARWEKQYDIPQEIPFHPARVLMQDFTGVPAVVDMAAMRDAVKAAGGRPEAINPLVPVDLVIDHSVQVDHYGTNAAQDSNVKKEYDRNRNRYELLKWAQRNFDNFKVVPPNSGICHQVNLECLARVIMTQSAGGITRAFPDTLVGTDSHTTMVNGIGVVGWGVGGIEAEAVMLGQPYYMTVPEVIGVRLTGALQPGVTATDLVLTVTEVLRKHKVVEKFVEFFGSGVKALSIPDRATVANMAPEYGATIGFFPVDEKTVAYLEATNRRAAARRTEAYAGALGLFYGGAEVPAYSNIIELDLSVVRPCISGPARPQDCIPLDRVKTKVETIIGRTALGVSDTPFHRQEKTGCDIRIHGRPARIDHGSVVIAAITSCTNTSNPAVMIGAGLLAKKAVEKGLRMPPFVKTSFAPGSKVVSTYMAAAGLRVYLEALGFYAVGHGCTTCIGNSGPLNPAIEQAIAENNLTVASVLSGNRNFDARIHQSVKANFLASPMLVVAFALAGRMDIDLEKEPIGLSPDGDPVYLKDISPSPQEIEVCVDTFVTPGLYRDEYATIFDGDDYWRGLPIATGTTYQWDAASTYIKLPPYFDQFSPAPPEVSDIESARALLFLGDSVTTDHISPAGTIPASYPAGRYLMENHVAVSDFNSYGSRRGNHEVMIRGTFGNIRIQNKLVQGCVGGYTRKFPEATDMFVYEAAAAYRQAGIALVVLGGKEYGTGSSRDWAAKGSSLLGVKAVIVESFERIHRSNLVGMGVLPLVLADGLTWSQLPVDGSERFAIRGIDSIAPRQRLTVTATKDSGETVPFAVIARLDTVVDVAYFNHGGILPYVLRKILAEKAISYDLGDQGPPMLQ